MSERAFCDRQRVPVGVEVVRRLWFLHFATGLFSLGGGLRAARTSIFRRVNLAFAELAMDVAVVSGLRLPVVTIYRLELAEKMLSECLICRALQMIFLQRMVAFFERC
eukprot:863959_1